MLSEKPRGGLSETRKMTKSTMEKKRRARINSSLTELKAILSGMIPNKGERFDKMEKADILEMTVKCVRQLQKQQTNTAGDTVRSSSCQVDEDYRSGMHTCMSEVIKFISSSQFSDADPDVKTKLLNHLANKLNTGTMQKPNLDRDEPILFKTHTIPEKSVHMSNMSMMDTDNLSKSDLSDDSNNNFQVSNENSTQFLKNTNEPKSTSPVPIIPSPVLTSYKQIQPVQDTVQQQGSIPTVPLTILVPANFCSATLGTTCVIPFNLPTASPQQLCQGNVIQTIPLSPQNNISVTSNPGTSLIQTPSFLQGAHLQAQAAEQSHISPPNKVLTFNPVIVSECSRTSTQSHRVSDRPNSDSRPNSASTVPFIATLTSHVRSATSPYTATHKSPQRSTTLPFTEALNSPERSTSGTYTAAINSPNRSTTMSFPATLSSQDQFEEFNTFYQNSISKAISKLKTIDKPSEDFLSHLTRNTETVHQKMSDSDKNYHQSVASKCVFSNLDTINDNHQAIRKPEHPGVSSKGKHIRLSSFSDNNIPIQPESRSAVFDRNQGNLCDSTQDMWRPWNATI